MVATYNNGSPVKIGDRVEVQVSTLPGIFDAGDSGIVADIIDDSAGVDWGRKSPHFHDLRGTLSSSTGYYVKANCLLPISQAHVKEEQKFLNAIKDNPMVMVAGSDVFTLSRSSLQDASAILKNRDKVLIEQFSSYKLMTQKKLDLANQRLQQAQIMPDISIQNLLRHKITVGKAEGYIGVTLPFLYCPLYVAFSTPTGASQIKLIDPRWAEEILKREVLLLLLFHENKPLMVRLLQPSGEEQFVHYHTVSSSHDCTGTVKIAGVELALADILAFRDNYQTVLQTINFSSIGQHNPRGLPPDSEVKNHLLAEEVKNDTWATVSMGLIPDDFSIGSMVKVLAPVDNFPTDWVGSIGKVVSHDIRGNNQIGVEFAFTNDLLHNCNDTAKSRQGYMFPCSCLESMPSGTRRNKKKPSEGGSEDDAES